MGEVNVVKEKSLKSKRGSEDFLSSTRHRPPRIVTDTTNLGAKFASRQRCNASEGR